ncbi:MAG TPA: hypothetical protein VHB20_15080 [Verrucomicrobiae bacterium]|jgi:hypothetical protein|nr:hypothetical protein [Verrucomicrobiae bacterium]
MKRKVAAYWAVTMALLIIALFFGTMRWGAKARLTHYRQQLGATGQTLEVEQLAPVWPDNDAIAAARMVREASTLARSIYGEVSSMKPLGPGRARVAWRQRELREQIIYGQPPTNIWPLVQGALAGEQDQIARFRGALARGIHLQVDYRWLNANIDSLEALKLATVMMQAAALATLHDGNASEALLDLRAEMRLARIGGEIPVIVYQLVGYACAAIAFNDDWEALQFPDWSEEQLAELQEDWETMDWLPGARKSLEMTRARSPIIFHNYRNANGPEWMRNDLDQIPGLSNIWQKTVQDPGAGAGTFLDRYPRFWLWKWAWSYDDERHYDEMLGQSIVALQSEGKILPTPPDPDVPVRNRAFGTAASAPTITRFVQKAFRAQTMSEMMTAGIALERFRRQTGKYPKSLAELVPRYLKRVPKDYMDGGELRYRLRTDGTLLLYSVGSDGKDDGGNPLPPKWQGTNFFLGRDLVWPSPADEPPRIVN